MGGVVAVVVAAGFLLAGPACAAPPYQEMAQRLVGTDQGVFARAEDGTVLVAVEADRPVHPASVSKIPTTLALLRRLGPEHRFETRVLGTGPVHDGTLDGDLISRQGPRIVDGAAAVCSVLDEVRRERAAR